MKVLERDEARRLRKQEGLSYKTIAKKLNVAKSSISEWCRGIELTDKQLKVLAHNCRLKSILGGNGNKVRWDKIKSDFLSNYIPPLDNARFMLGLGIYWGEGSKYSENTTRMSNCDPKLLKKFLGWISEFFPECKGFSVRVHHYTPEKDAQVKKFWSNNLGLPLSCFKHSVFGVSGASEKKRNTLINGTVDINCNGKDVWKVQQKIRKALAAVYATIG